MSENNDNLKMQVASLETQLKDISQNLEDVKKDLNAFALLSRILIKSIQEKKEQTHVGSVTLDANGNLKQDVLAENEQEKS
jgi:hypothetical protein